jgi:hypothetical protein
VSWNWNGELTGNAAAIFHITNVFPSTIRNTEHSSELLRLAAMPSIATCPVNGSFAGSAKSVSLMSFASGLPNLMIAERVTFSPAATEMPCHEKAQPVG